MLFNSYIFLLFMIFCLPLYYFLNPIGRYIYLLLWSAFFFGSIANFFIFLISTICNGLGAWGLITLRKKNIPVKYLFSVLICSNVSYLFYFKYLCTGFMPLALSFYTFEQITFLHYISFNKEFSKNILSIKDYILFISFFPRLLAGPIYYYDEYKDKLQQMLSKLISWEDIGRGFAIFFLGLFKKTVCADQLAPLVDVFYNDPRSFSTLDTWFATFAYSLQIYFDFSAYSEMAVGLAMMLGVILPLNFNSPYKATSIIDFWSRWHMTLSRFIKDYVYIPLGGNVKHQTCNILLTMSIAGLWHGSSLNFLAWGFLHGILIASNHLVRRYNFSFFFPSFAKIFIVFIIINTTWILFRALSFSDAFLVFQQYLGMSVIDGFHFGKKNVIILLAFLSGVFILPNIKNIFFEEKLALFKWNIPWTFLGLLLFIVSYLRMNHEKTFIYFNF